MGRLGVLLWETRLTVSKQLAILDFAFDPKTIVDYFGDLPFPTESKLDCISDYLHWESIFWIT